MLDLSEGNESEGNESEGNESEGNGPEGNRSEDKVIDGLSVDTGTDNGGVIFIIYNI